MFEIKISLSKINQQIPKRGSSTINCDAKSPDVSENLVSNAPACEILDQQIFGPGNLMDLDDEGANEGKHANYKSKAHESNDLPNLNASRKMSLRYKRSEITLDSLKLNIPITARDQLNRSNFIAKGGQASVWTGSLRGTDVAYKIFPKTDKSYMALREMKLLCRIRHPNIISIMSVSEGYTDYVIVMEYFDSYSLKQVTFSPNVKAVYNLNLHQKNVIAKQLCLALNFLHLDDVPIVHRDVKPENVLVEWTGEVRMAYNIKLCDMGMSKCKDLISELQTSENNCGLKGTEFYMSPEVMIKKQEATVKSDVWSTGCTILELYSERETWNFPKSDIQTNRVAEAFMKGQSPKVTGVPDFLKDLLIRCFRHEPSERPEIKNILAILKKEISRSTIS